MPRKPMFKDASSYYKKIVEDAICGMHWPWKSLRINAKYVGRLLDINVKGLGAEGHTILPGWHACLALHLDELARLRCLDDGTTFDQISIVIAADASYRAVLKFNSDSGKGRSITDKGTALMADPPEGMPRCDVVSKNNELHNTGMYMAELLGKKSEGYNENGFLVAPGNYAFQVLERLKKKSYQELLALPERARLEFPKRVVKPGLFLFRYTWLGYHGIEVMVDASYWPEGRFKFGMSPSFEMGARGKIYGS